MQRMRAQRRLPRTYRAIIALLRPALMVLTRRDWAGGEHLPPSGGFVVAPNHLSYVDPLTFAHFLVDHGHAPFFLAKEEVFRLPVAGRLVAAAQQIPVDRNSGRARDAFRAGAAAVREGKCVAILPEGTLTRDPGLWPMTGKTGAARVALTTRCPVIPVAQWGPQEILAPYSTRLRLLPRRTVHLLAGPAVDLTDLYARPLDGATLQEATSRIMAAITALLEQLRGEVAPAERFDPRAAGVADTGNPMRPGPRRPSTPKGDVA